MENNRQKNSRSSQIFKATFYIMLAWACAVLNSTSLQSEGHAQTLALSSVENHDTEK